MLAIVTTISYPEYACSQVRCQHLTCDRAYSGYEIAQPRPQGLCTDLEIAVAMEVVIRFDRREL